MSLHSNMPSIASEPPASLARGAGDGARGFGASMPRVEHEAGGIVLAEWRNLTINVWGGRVTRPALDALDRMGRTMARKFPDGFSSLHLVVDNTPLPEPEARSRLDEISKTHAADIGCIITVIEGDGFWRSAVRSFITGLHWVERRPYEAHTCSSIDELVDVLPRPHWERTGVPLRGKELDQAVRWVRARVDG